MTVDITALPTEWFNMPPLIGDDETVRGILKNPHHAFTTATRQTEPDAGARLAVAVRSAHGTHARFSYPKEHGALHAVTMLASWLGLAGDGVHEQLGGTATIVRSGLGHRHDQQWHTDSTPWRQPNVMTMLGQVHLAEGIEPPATDLLPLRRVEQALAADPAALHLLRTQLIPWRRNFPDLEQFSAPILGIDAPRWVQSVLDDLHPDLDSEMIRAVEVLKQVLNESPAVEVTVQPGELVMFDNRANLHRGPRIEQNFERRLVRIKLGGRPEWQS